MLDTAAVLVGSALQPPYTVTLNNLGTGEYTISARARDNARVSRSSVGVHFTVGAHHGH